MSVSVRNIVDKQNELHGLISRAGPNLKKLEIKRRTPEYVQTRIDLLDANWKKFQDNHDMLTSLKKEDRTELSYFQENLYEVCEDAYADSKSQMLSYRKELSKEEDQPSLTESKTSCANHAPSSRQLPRIYLPRFSGLYREWRNFRDLFTSMITKNKEISDVEKLQYLKVNLSGEALQLVVNFDVTDDNFARAWQVLVDRYENKRVLIDSHLSSLFSLQHVTQQSPTQIKSLLGGVKEALGALHSLGCPTDSWDCLIVYMITHKLDSETLMDWEQQIGAVTEPATFAELEKYLRSRIYALEAVARATGTQKSRVASSGKPQSSAKSHQVVANSTSDVVASKETRSSASSCMLCSGSHYLSACPDYHRKTIDQRQDVLKQKSLCFNCLGPHQLRNCRSDKRCRICGNPHHTLIHRSNNSSEIQAPAFHHVQKPNSAASVTASDQPSASVHPRRENNQVELSASTNVALSVSVNYTPVLLATAYVKVTSCYGELYEARALLDQGSEVSFITESLAQQLRLPRQRISLPINGIGAQRSTVSRGLINLTLVSRVAPAFSLSVNAYVLPKLTSYMPPSRVVRNPWPHLDGLELADPEFSSTAKIDLILGAQVYGAILEDGLRKGGPGSPIAQKTTLGWVLSGSVSSESRSDLIEHSAQGLQCSIDFELQSLVQRFWEQEEVNTSPRAELSNEEHQCEQFFKKTHSRDSTGRYIVRIPLKQNPEDLGNSYTPALRALIRQENRFALDSSIKSAYSKFMAEYEVLNHMALVPAETSRPRNAFYLPHHSVIRESSSTTTVRVVFNGSSRTNYGISVNDLQYVGPKLQTNLADVITRWRRYFYVFTADVEKMYRQIRIHADDRDLQRIVWRSNPESPPLSYHLHTVTYGLASAPYLAIRTLQQLANDEGNRFPLATEIIRREIYVDDVLSGADSIQEAQEKIRQVDECFASGCFILKKWTASDEKVLSRISPEKREQTSPVSLETEQFFNALGILWHPQTDSFAFTSYSTTEQYRPTKRTVLSRVSQLFDPLGWIAPVVVRGKILIQNLWSAKLTWDEPLTDEFVSQWNKFEKDLHDIASISVPRWLGYSASSSVVELHGFSDASQSALGAVIYLRVITDLNDARVTLVSAKTRVAPLKKVTIPRLELSAALLLVRQISVIRETLDLNKIPIHLWTDSTVALAYIRGDARRWGDYVQNRVTEIQELSNCQWHHISGKDNPADCASRGLSPTELRDHALWWNGPAWLSQHSTRWPPSNPTLDPDTALELRKVPVTTAIQSQPPKVWDLVDRFSNLNILLRITAWCFRAIKKFRRHKDAANKSSSLTPEELNHARLFWVKITQTAFFKVEIDLLRRSKPILRSSSLLRLAPYLDGSDLLRVGGRLQNSLLDHDEKHPLILPRESALTSLIIDEAHRRTFHGGTQLTLVTLRRRYWIVGGRVPISTFIHRCVQCTRQRATLGQQLMGQLPQSRTIQSRPFLHTGVDYAGPLTLRTFRGRDAKTYKGYIVLFVCFSSSAVHLEIATDYSTDGFIAAYKRFTSRRGICATLSSDCGSNFIGADNELRKLFQASSKESVALANILANDGTRWKFNPPSSPHFGGKWEAAVKSVKFHLKRVIGDTGLTYEEFSTLLSQIEAVLNSRPLCPLSDDPTDPAALTPGHFLIGTAMTTTPEPALIDIPRSRLSRWQLIRQMLEQFWKRWSAEYLQHLQTRSKWQRSFNDFKIGSLVLIADERYPPSKWALGRITDVHPGQDNLVRVATVKTQHSVFKRPIVKLVLLPISNTEDYSRNSPISSNE